MRIALKDADYSNNYISKDINYDYPNDEWQNDKGFTQLNPSNVGNASLVNQPLTMAEANNNKFAALSIRLKKGDKFRIENGHSQTSGTSLWGMYDANTLKLVFASEVKAATIAQEVEHTIEYDDVYFVVSALVKFQGNTTYAPKITVTKFL